MRKRLKLELFWIFFSFQEKRGFKIRTQGEGCAFNLLCLWQEIQSRIFRHRSLAIFNGFLASYIWSIYARVIWSIYLSVLQMVAVEMCDTRKKNSRVNSCVYGPETIIILHLVQRTTCSSENHFFPTTVFVAQVIVGRGVSKGLCGHTVWAVQHAIPIDISLHCCKDVFHLLFPGNLTLLHPNTNVWWRKYVPAGNMRNFFCGGGWGISRTIQSCVIVRVGGGWSSSMVHCDTRFVVVWDSAWALWFWLFPIRASSLPNSHLSSFFLRWCAQFSIFSQFAILVRFESRRRCEATRNEAPFSSYFYCHYFMVSVIPTGFSQGSTADAQIRGVYVIFKSLRFNCWSICKIVVNPSSAWTISTFAQTEDDLSSPKIVFATSQVDKVADGRFEQKWKFFLRGFHLNAAEIPLFPVFAFQPRPASRTPWTPHLVGGGPACTFFPAQPS